MGLGNEGAGPLSRLFRDCPTARRARSGPRPLAATLWFLCTLSGLPLAGPAAVGRASELIDVSADAVAARWVHTPDSSPYARRGPVELATIERALSALGRAPVHDPWGHPVCAVHVWREPVFRAEDLIPVWANRLHHTTRERRLQRIVPIAQGDVLERDAWAHAERDIRDPENLSVSALVTVAGEAPGCVDVVIVTRDAWSLTTNVAVESNGRTLSQLYLGVTESNLFGTGDALTLSASRTPGAWSVGPTYLSPHLAGTHLAAYGAARALLDREVGGLEGFSGAASLSLPFYRPAQRWAWSASAQAEDALRRRYVGSELTQWVYDAPEGSADEVVDDRYRVSSAAASTSVTRQWGEAHRHRLSPSFAYSATTLEPVPRDPGLSRPAIDAYDRDRLPRDERVVGPGLAYAAFANRHLRLIDYNTFAVTEEVRVGPATTTGLSWSEPSLGASARFIAASQDLSWTLPLGPDGFVVGAFSVNGRGAASVTDLDVGGAVRVVTPRVVAGRIVARVAASAIVENTGNGYMTIGGDNGLRGYPSNYLSGTRRLQANLEWRSRPIRVFQARLGAVAFVDAGSAWLDRSAPYVLPGAGVGLRLMLPIIGTYVRAADLSFPLRPAGAPLFSFGLEQAF